MLSYIVTPEGMSSDPAISHVAIPSMPKQVQSFLGMVNYYSKTIPHYGKVVESLLQLTCKNTHFHWGLDQQRAFETLKDALMSDQVMAFPNLNREYDASDHSVGDVLAQHDDFGNEKVIQYLSHQLTPAHRSWPTIVKECYSIVFAIDHLWFCPPIMFTFYLR